MTANGLSRPLSGHSTFSVSVFNCIVEDPSTADGQVIYIRNPCVKPLVGGLIRAQSGVSVWLLALSPLYSPHPCNRHQMFVDFKCKNGHINKDCKQHEGSTYVYINERAAGSCFIYLIVLFWRDTYSGRAK